MTDAPAEAAEGSNGRLVAWTTFVLVLGALGFASRFGGTPKERVPVFFQWSFGIGGLVQYAVMLGIVLAIAARLRKREAFALWRPRSIGRAVGIAVLAVIGVFAIETVVSQFANPERAQGILPGHWVSGHVGAFVLSTLAVAVAAPVVEELTFRGLGYTLLVEHGRWIAIVGVGVAFGIAHGIVSALPVLIPFGAALAYLRDRTRSVYPGMVVHALFNAVAVVHAVT